MLSICIPNFNRISFLNRLLSETIRQIDEDQLYEDVEICISDNASTDDIEGLVQKYIHENPKINIVFFKAQENMGMDNNFNKVVSMANMKYCWLVGNDDLFAPNALQKVVEKLKTCDVDLMYMGIKPQDSDSIIFSFDKCTEKSQMIQSGKRGKNFFDIVSSDLSVCGFISHVIFKKENWVLYASKFYNKIGTTIIQVYIHLATIIDDAKIMIYNELMIYSGKSYSLPQDRIPVVNYLIVMYDALKEMIPEIDCKDDIINKVVDWSNVNFVCREHQDEEIMKKYISLPLKINNFLDKCYICNSECKQYYLDKKVYIFGASKSGKRAFEKLKSNDVDVIAFIDNNPKKWNTKFCDLRIVSPEDVLRKNREDNCEIVIASVYWEEIQKQLYVDYNFTQISVV